MQECKGEEVFDANLIGASSGRGKGSMKVSLYRTSQMFIADGGMVEAVGEVYATINLNNNYACNKLPQQLNIYLQSIIPIFWQ